MEKRLIEGAGRGGGRLTVRGALWCVIAVLILVIVAVSAATLRAPPEESPAAPSGGEATSAPDIRIWTGIGRLRCPLKRTGASLPATAVLSVVFYYNHADAAFTRELARSNAAFRRETAALFAGLDAGSPLLRNEDALKTELRARYNKLLRLGRLETLYFSDFILIE